MISKPTIRRVTGVLLLLLVPALVAAAALYATFREHGRDVALVGSFAFLALGFSLTVAGYASGALSQMAESYQDAGARDAVMIASTLGRCPT